MSALLLITQERTREKLPKKSALLQKKKSHSGPLFFVLLMFILIEIKQKTSPNFKNFFPEIKSILQVQNNNNTHVTC